MKHDRLDLAYPTLANIRPPAWSCLLLVTFAIAMSSSALADETEPAHSRDHLSESVWVQPRAASDQPLWGFRDGIRVGLPPLPGPRGLLRIYAPYLGQTNGHVINYIAIEPVTAINQVRGLSELEHSKSDNTRGKHLSTANSAEEDNDAPTQPASGTVQTIDGVAHLCVYIHVESFDNGAHVYLKLTFRADRPHEFGIATFATPDSTPLQNCILTATMGNYARLRKLELASQTISPAQLWPEFHGNGFTPHEQFPLAELTRNAAGDAIVFARPDEAEPEKVEYAAGTRSGWHYHGTTAEQYWRAPQPDPQLAACVNARRVYWNSESPIPGGAAFENFELVSPFQPGQQFWFGIEPFAVTGK